ncbi:unnamed protein product [Ascophyllum nodosum]
MGFSRVWVATTTAMVAVLYLLAHSISSAGAFHTMPPALRPGRYIPPSAASRPCSSVAGGWTSGAASSVRRTIRRGRRGRPGGALRMGDSGGDKGGSVVERTLATVVYLLPLLDGLDFGENVFRVCPQLGTLLHLLLGPALGVWKNVPFMPLVMFIILQISVRRQDTSRFVRFNVQQAILVDILTVVLGLLGTAVGYLIPEGEEFMTNFAFYCLAGAVAYAVTETVRGRLANQIPLISAAAEIQIGPGR